MNWRCAALCLALLALVPSADAKDVPIIIIGPNGGGGSGLTISITPQNPSVPADTAAGSTVAAIIVTGSANTPSLGFGAPNFDDGGLFALAGSLLTINPAGPGISGLTGSTQFVTITATSGGVSASQTVAVSVTPFPVSIALASVVQRIPDDSPAGTFVATAVVTMSDGSTNFTGSLTSSDTLFAISLRNIVTARPMNTGDDGVHSTVIATQP